MFKRLLLLLVLLVALGAGGVYLLFNYPGVVVKAALEYWTPDVLGTQITLDDIQISARTGRGSIRGLEVGNPPGYSSKRAARFGEVRVALDPFTLTDDVIVIHEIAIDSPQITYERGSKATNLEVIQGHIDAFAKRAAANDAARQAQGESRKRRFIIERIEIRGGRVLMTNASLKGQGLGFDLPEVLLRDVGKAKGGVSASEAAAQVASAVRVRIAQKVLTNVDLLRKGGVEGAVDALKGLVK